MKDIKEIQRLTSPALRPQSLAWSGSTLWMGSLETRLIYEINPATWRVEQEIAPPGIPWGMAAVGNELRVLCGETARDNRIIRRWVPRQGFDACFGIPCPNDLGSHLSFDGQRLYLSQWYPKKLLELGPEEEIGRVINVPHEIVGQVFAAGCFYLVTTDDEKTTDYWLTRVDPRPATPKIDDLARIPFAARGLTFDGRNFWTNHREQNQIVSFARAD